MLIYTLGPKSAAQAPVPLSMIGTLPVHDAMIDMDQARQFIAALTGSESTVCCWQTFADRPEDKANEERRRELSRHRDLPLRAAQDWLLRANADAAGIYVTVNATDGRGRLIENVIGLRALFVDCDGTAALDSVSFPIAPAIIVQRDATHWHAYWLLQRGESLDAFTRSQVQIAAFYGTDVSVKDLPRVMRVPGFQHRKAEPQAVVVRRAEAGAQGTIAEILAAHPVDWSQFDEKSPYHKAAVACGLIAPPTPAPRSHPITVASSSPAGARPAGGKPSPFEMMRRWMLKLPVTEGSGNDRGGRDNAAFALACECSGRGLSEHEATELVDEYFRRSGGGRDADTSRVVRSAFSKPRNTRNMPAIYDRQDDGGPQRTQRMHAAPTAVEDVFGDPEDSSPGVPPDDGDFDGGGGGGGGGDDAGGGDDRRPPWARDLDLAQIFTRWAIGAEGVVPLELTKDGAWSQKPNKRVADLPIWPVQQGTDVATGSSYWLVRWLTPTRGVRDQWLTEMDMKLGLPLVALPDAPVPKKTSEGCATWLTAARVAVRAEPCKVTSRLGWCGTGDDRQWIWPSDGADGVRYIGSELGPAGDLEVWRVGVDHLVELGDAGLPGLVALGFAAGAAWSRLNGATPRNPILGLMGTSSTGKGTILGYALSMWTNPDHLSLPASSTAKGLQDRATGIPDLPILVDELQQLAERDQRQAADALYYLANGQRRITSSKAQTAVGGERRYGAGFYAAEAPILDGQNEGVLVRVIELKDVAFAPSEAAAKIIQSGIRAAGAPAAALAAHLNATPAAEWRRILEGYAVAWRERITERRGDDAVALALLQVGLEALGTVLDADLRPQVVCTWLRGHLGQQRQTSADRETRALHQTLDTVLNAYWKDDAAGPNRSYSEGRDGQPVAWRLVADDPGVFEPGADGVEVQRKIVAQLDVNPAADLVRRLIVEHGGQDRLLSAWRKRGWIKVDGRHNTVKKTHRGSPIGRVVRFTGLALQTYFDHDPESRLLSDPAARPLPPVEPEPPF